MLNLLWLLLPVAAAGGWFAARRSTSEGNPDRFWDHASNYHRGLNYLLNEQQGKADDLFLSSADVNQETAETHLALGNMFRRRGEVDRAIRVHKSLNDKLQLSEAMRADALLELARDYDKAGLLDRSEKLFRQLIEQGHKVEISYQNLLSIYEREKDWERAIDIALEYSRHTNKNMYGLIAHYYCELAVVADRAGLEDEALEHLQKALIHDVDCARASVMWGELALRRKDYAKAIERFEFVEKHRPELMPEIISPMFEALSASGNQQALRDYIERIKSRLNAYSVIKKTRGLIEQLDGKDEADEFFKDQIVARPSLKGLRDWAQGQLQKSPEKEREKVAAMCNMLDQVVRSKPSYQCSNCGFRGQSLHWRCPSCGHWDSVQTIIGAEGE